MTTGRVSSCPLVSVDDIIDSYRPPGECEEVLDQDEHEGRRQENRVKRTIPRFPIYALPTEQDIASPVV